MAKTRLYGNLFHKFFKAHVTVMGNDAYEKRRKYKRLWRKAKLASGIDFSKYKLAGVCPISSKFLWYKPFPSVCQYVAEVKFPFIKRLPNEVHDPEAIQEQWDEFLKANKFIIDFELVDGSVWLESEVK